MREVMYVVLFLMLVAQAFGLGYTLGSRERKPKVNAVSAPESTLSVEELERIRKEREELKAEQAAFLSMVGYNADIAYGLNQNPLEGS